MIKSSLGRVAVASAILHIKTYVKMKDAERVVLYKSVCFESWCEYEQLNTTEKQHIRSKRRDVTKTRSKKKENSL